MTLPLSAVVEHGFFGNSEGELFFIACIVAGRVLVVRQPKIKRRWWALGGVQGRAPTLHNFANAEAAQRQLSQWRASPVVLDRVADLPEWAKLYSGQCANFARA
jgi:hypothetical protein